MMSSDDLSTTLKEIRSLVRAATYPTIKALLESALVDDRQRTAYQMLDGSASIDQVRAKCKMGPNTLVALTQKWVSMGLMEATDGNKRRRLFNLIDYGLSELKE